MKQQPQGLLSVSEVLSHLAMAKDCYFDKKAAARYLGWSPRKLDEFLSEIPHFKHGGKTYFKRSQLDQYMDEFAVAGRERDGLDLKAMAAEAMNRLRGVR